MRIGGSWIEFERPGLCDPPASYLLSVTGFISRGHRGSIVVSRFVMSNYVITARRAVPQLVRSKAWAHLVRLIIRSYCGII